jgi:DNA replication regulator DPB11
MRYADKFNRAGEASIQIVWEEWFWDCLEYGGRQNCSMLRVRRLISWVGRFEEDKYAVTQPRPERKSVTGDPPAHPLPQLSSAPPTSTFPTPTPAPARPTTPVNKPANEEAEEEEIVRVRRVPAETLQVWESVLRPRGFVLSGGRLQRSPSKSQNAPSTSPCPPGPGTLPLPTRARTLQDLPGPRQSALVGLSRIHSFAPNVKDTSTPKQIFRKTTSEGARALTPENSSFLGGIQERDEAEAEMGAFDGVAPPPPHQAEPAIGKRAVTQNAEAGPSRARAAFSGMKFQAYGEAHCDTVQKAIEGAGGEVLPEDDEGEPDFIIVRLVRYCYSSLILGIWAFSES